MSSSLKALEDNTINTLAQHKRMSVQIVNYELLDIILINIRDINPIFFHDVFDVHHVVITAEGDYVKLDLFVAVLLILFEIVKDDTQTVIAKRIITIVCVESIDKLTEIDRLFHDKGLDCASPSLVGVSALTVHCIGFYLARQNPTRYRVIRPDTSSDHHHLSSTMLGNIHCTGIS